MAERGSGREPAARLTRVTKRDGRELGFDVEKIRRAVLRATAAVGDEDEAYAAEVAALVELALREEYRDAGERIPSIEDIQDTVERALIETGRAQVAKAYILYRDHRTRVREALRVESRDHSDIRVQDTAGTSPWSKGRIVAALMTEAELPRESASEVAAAVEEKVFDTGLARITTGLVRELVDIELARRGWTHALHRQEPVSLPRHDLRRALAGHPLRAWENDGWHRGAADGGDGLEPWPAEGGDRLEGPVSGRILERFALRELLAEPIAEMHVAGDLHVEDLGRPHLPLVLSVRSDLLARGEPSPGSAFALLEELATLVGECAHGIVLEDPGSALQPLARGTRAKSPLGLSAWLRSVDALARASRRHIDLGSPGERFSSFTARLVEELAGLASGGLSSGGAVGPRLFLEAEEALALVREFPQVKDLVERLCAEGRIVPTWSSDDEVFAAPGCRRIGREQGALDTGGAVALNLPRIARRAGPWREDLALELLSGAVQCALAACRSLEAARSAWSRPSTLRTRTSYAVSPVGLREALRLLGDGEIDPGLGARLLGFLGEATRRFATESGLHAVLSPFFGARAARRFAHADREVLRRREEQQGELFATATIDQEKPYSVGFRLSPVIGREPGEAEAALVTTLPSGALYPLPGRSTPMTARGLGQGAAGAPFASAAATSPAPWEIWARRRLGAQGSRERGLFVPQPPPATDAGLVSDSAAY